jgi:Lipocalin-like domain
MANDETEHTLESRLIGSWRMTSWICEILATGERFDPLGPNPNGYITYTPDGRVMVLVLSAERPTPASLIPTPEEKLALYDTMFAYSGTYELKPDRVIHHIDMSWNKAWEGTQQVRYLELAGDKLTYRSAPAKSPLDGRDCVHLVTFKKVS